MKRLTPALAVTGAALLVLTACGGGGGSSTTTAATTSLDAETQALVDQAKAAGPITFYSIINEASLRKVADTISKKYGVEVKPLRLVSADLTQRYSAEASTGKASADVIMVTYSRFFDEALAKKWIQPLPDLLLPASTSSFPTAFVEKGAVPIVSLIPTETVYNTDNVKDKPTAWTDYADPKFKGKLMLAEPNSSPANAAFWSLMRQQYGDDFLRQVAANSPKWSSSATPVTQGVAAGEADLGHPGVAAIVKELKGSGAPVELAAMTPTTGPETGLGVSVSSPNPAGGKLIVTYLMSQEGSTLLNDETAAFSPYNTEALKGFTRVKDITNVDPAAINTLLGRQ
jgi:iron(III) transport system substrate-binding protein